jgi:hypothetical protein
LGANAVSCTPDEQRAKLAERVLRELLAEGLIALE